MNALIIIILALVVGIFWPREHLEEMPWAAGITLFIGVFVMTIIGCAADSMTAALDAGLVVLFVAAILFISWSVKLKLEKNDKVFLEFSGQIRRAKAELDEINAKIQDREELLTKLIEFGRKMDEAKERLWCEKASHIKEATVNVVPIKVGNDEASA